MNPVDYSPPYKRYRRKKENSVHMAYITGSTITRTVLQTRPTLIKTTRGWETCHGHVSEKRERTLIDSDLTVEMYRISRSTG